MDNVFIVFGMSWFKQTVGIQTGTNCVPIQLTYFFIRLRLT